MPLPFTPEVADLPTDERVFQSVAHPREASAALIYSRAMVQPLGMTMIPVMCAALAAVLAGQRLWPALFWASAVALAGAWAWARFQLGRTPAEVRVRTGGHAAAVRSVRDVLLGRAPDWQYLVRLRRERLPAALRVDLGDQTYRLLAAHWPRADALAEALHLAAQS